MQNKLVRSYDFAFGFCIPSSTNSWEAVYDNLPVFTPEQKDQYVSEALFEDVSGMPTHSDVEE